MQNVVQWLLDLLYPPRCMICRRLLERQEMPVCRSCLDALPDFDDAPPQLRFAQSCAVTFYYEDDLRSAFLRYKFFGRRSYAQQFGKWLAVTVSDKLKGKFELVTWVPVSRKRKKERTYDQAELLCHALCREMNLSPIPLLKKSRHTLPQSKLHDYAMRNANARGAYELLPEADVAGKRILLIDDIVTTGATLNECCRVLLTAGAKSVVCAALAAPRKQGGKI